MNVELTRRSVMKMSAALAGVTTATNPKEQLAHITTLVREGKAVESSLPPTAWGNAAVFADGIEESITTMFCDLGDLVCPTIWAKWKQAEIDLYRMFPELNRPFPSPMEDLWEATLAFVLHAFLDGVKRGALLEQVRREWLPTVALCRPCGGEGVLLRTGEPVDDAPICASCNGTGTVAVQPGDRGQYARS